MKKKIISVLLTMTMVFSMFVPGVSAADVWKTNVGTPGTPWGNIPSTYYLTSDAAHGGSVSLFVNGDQTNDSLNMIQAIGDPDTLSNYTLTFYAKEANEAGLSDGAGLFWSWNVQVRYSSGTGVVHCNDTAWTATQEADGWWKYTATYMPNAGDSNLHIIFNRGRNDIPIYIDDISLVKEGTTENLVKNGGFEGEESVLEPVVEPTIALTAGNGELTANWTNPSVASTALTMTVNGEAVDISGADLGASAQNTKVITGLKFGVDYTVELTAKTERGDFVVSANSKVYAGSCGTPGTPWGNVPSGYYLTNDTAHSGTTSLVVNGDTTAVNDAFNMIQNIGDPDTSSNYTLTFYAKEANIAGLSDGAGIFWPWNIQMRYSSGTGVAHCNDTAWTATQEADGWWKYTATYKPNAGDSNLHIIFNRDRNDIPIFVDDISLVKEGSDVNLVNNGGFETESENPDEPIEPDVPDVPDEPTDKVYGLPAAPWGNIPSGYYATCDAAHSGNMALFVNGDTTAVNDAFNMIQAIGDPDTSSNYTLTFYAKEANTAGLSDGAGLFWSWNVQVRYSSGAGVVHCNDTAWTATQEADGWWKYTATYTPNAGDSNLHVIFNRDRSDIPIYIDDISLVKAGTTENLVVNGGFEDIVPFKPTVTSSFDDSQITVNWINPPVESTKVTMTLNGEAVTLDSVNLAANSTNTKTVNGLTNGTPYEVVITCESAFGDLYDTITVIPRKIEQGTATGWSIEQSKYFYVTTSESKKNIAALKIYAPQNTIADGGSMEFTQPVEIEVGATYTVSFYAKILSGNKWDYKVQLGGWQAYNLDNAPSFWTTEDAGDGWVKYTKTDYTPADGDSNIHIVVCNAAEKSMYIDDLVIIKNSDETNTNIVTNGDFETFVRMTEAAAYGYCDSYNYLYWTVSGNADYFKIYKLDGENRTLIGATSDGNTDYFEVEAGIAAGDKFVVTSVINGEESDGITIKEGINAYPVFAIGTVNENGEVSITEELTAIQSGNILAGVKIATSSATDIKYDMFVVLYNDEELVHVIKLDTKTISDADLMTTTATTINIPEIAEDDDYSIGVMVWEDETLKPLTEKFELR